MFTDVFQPHGAMCLNNFGGIEIELSRCGEKVRYRFNYGEPTEPVESEIQYLPNLDYSDTEETTEDGLYATFMVGDTAYFLNDFVRT